MRNEQELPNKAGEIDNVNTRRSFFKKAALGGSLIATVSSRPVWAGRCSISGNLSNNNSHYEQANEVCHYNSFSPGGWINGAASGRIRGNGSSHPNLWTYTGFSRGDDISDLLPSITSSEFSGSIEDALTSNNGPVKQWACAALNAALWEEVTDYCQTGSPLCQIAIDDIAEGFYFPTDYWSLADLQALTLSQAAAYETTWSSIQNM